MKKDVARRTAVFGQLLADQVLVVAVGNVDLHPLARRDLADDPRQVLRHGVILVGKRNPLRPRPTEPRAGVRMPFGRKRVAESGGGSLQNGGSLHSSATNRRPPTV